MTGARWPTGRSTATARTWPRCGCCRPPGWSARLRPSGSSNGSRAASPQRGALYDLEGDEYFARASDEAFGSVSGLDRAEMLELSAERGGDPGRPGKKDPLDALVWLAARPDEPAWASRFGQGRPGWHVECAAISTEYLGSRFDVQAGGTDLIFPHHEMSASHARVALDPDAFARHYVHAGMVRLDGEKMSKSLGNLVFVNRLLGEGHDPMAVRLAILAHHYRRDWDWTGAGLAAAADRLARWREAVRVRARRVPAPPRRRAGRGAGAARRRPRRPGSPGGRGRLGRRSARCWRGLVALGRAGGWAGGAGRWRPVPAAASTAAELVRDTVDALLGVVL